MTKRLYYDQPALLEFDSVVETVASDPARPAVTLRETAFYPTSGGQVHDTGWLVVGSERYRVVEVADGEDGRVVHYLDPSAALSAAGTAEGGRLYVGVAVHGSIDAGRRRDHMQQHTGQHVLSAAFVELFQMPTVSFHMAEDYCSIDLATAAVSAAQVVAAEKRANEIVFENRPVRVRYATREEAETLGLRKLPPAERDLLRLMEVENFDLSACGGTHVSATGQIGSILLRKTEKVRQGIRVEFVCGDRAVRIARRDYSALSEAAALLSARMWELPEQLRKNEDSAKVERKQKEEALEQLAELMAAAEMQGRPEGQAVVVRVFADRDIAFAKLFAQKVARGGRSKIAFVASTVGSPGLVFAQSPGGQADMGALLKQVLASVGGRGGGSRDFAQGGAPAGADVEQLLKQAAGTIGA